LIIADLLYHDSHTGQYLHTDVPGQTEQQAASNALAIVRTHASEGMSWRICSLRNFQPDEGVKYNV
jgi:hypothetical protein